MPRYFHYINRGEMSQFNSTLKQNNTIQMTDKIEFTKNRLTIYTPEYPKSRYSFNDSQRQKTYIRTCATSEDSDQPVHSHRLIRIFTGRILIANDANCLHANAQADLSLRWAHMSEGTVSSRITAHML